MNKTAQYVTLLLVVMLLPVTGQTAEQFTVNTADQRIKIMPGQSPLTWEQAALRDSKARQQWLLRELDATRLLLTQPRLKVPSQTSAEDNKALLKNIDQAQQQLVIAKKGLVGISGGQGLGDLLHRLLHLARAQLLGEKPTARPAEQSRLLASTQRDLDAARKSVKSFPDKTASNALLQRLDSAQEQLNKVKRQVNAKTNIAQ